MNPTLLSALAALAGALIGGLASLGSSWLTQSIQQQARHREHDRARREALFTDFINEASRLYGDALSHEKDDVLDMVQLYAIVGRIRLISCDRVVASAEKTMESIIGAYLAPNKSLRELRTLMIEGKMDFLVEFSEAARYELDAFPRTLRAMR
jgi:ABC-type branched-subunit amino acid transport system ATPase component